MRIMLPDPETHEVVEALIALDPQLGPKLSGFVYETHSRAEILRRTDLVHRVTTSTARALLAAKIVMPSGDTKLQAEIEKSLSDARHAPALRDLALSIVKAEVDTEDDAFRDKKSIPDAVFNRRLAHIREFLAH
uniref:hypothetical protein n=1 Tax=Cupriavidus taiwanensis TaxID=164546 RepID=UPI003F49369C